MNDAKEPGTPVLQGTDRAARGIHLAEHALALELLVHIWKIFSLDRQAQDLDDAGPTIVKTPFIDVSRSGSSRTCASGIFFHQSTALSDS